jgi:hypothetical protein
MPTTPTGKTDKELALWMLDRMADSDEFLGALRKARIAGKRDILDAPDYIAKHKARLLTLHKSGSEEDTDMTTASAAWIDALVERDLLSSREEFLDKAIEAYVEKYGADQLPAGAGKSIVDAARDEIEGKTSGAFEPGFMEKLAAAARQERVMEQSKSQMQERGGRD